MAGYTKQDFDTLYSIRLRILDPITGNYKRSKVRLHYHRAVIKRDFTDRRWASIWPILNIRNTDRVVIVGTGFGWGVEALVAMTGCTAIGTDISDHVAATKDIDERDEIEAAIVEAGLDPTKGDGLEAFNAAYTPGARAKSTVLIEDMNTNKSRVNIKKEIGNLNPTWIITEDMITDFTDQEVLDLSDLAGKFTDAKVCHIVRENYPPNAKTLEQWNLLTGATIIGLGSFRRVG